MYVNGEESFSRLCMILGKYSVAKSAASGSVAQIENIFCLHRGDLMRLVHLVHFHVRLDVLLPICTTNRFFDQSILFALFSNVLYSVVYLSFLY